MHDVRTCTFCSNPSVQQCTTAKDIPRTFVYLCLREQQDLRTYVRTYLHCKVILLGKRHNRVHPGHFATQQGTPIYPAGMSAADWSTLVFTLPRRKMAWVHPTMATFFQNCTLILDKYPAVSENETLPPAISPAEITLRSRQRAPKYTSSRAKHTVRHRHQGPASSSA